MSMSGAGTVASEFRGAVSPGSLALLGDRVVVYLRAQEDRAFSTGGRRVYDVSPVLAQLSGGLVGVWVIVAAVAILALVVTLRIVRRAVALSIRLAIILGALLVIAAALYILSRYWIGEGLPIS
jgi:hypothetical protein